jgi:uncharacterized SAM-binding protein YcdF (DUF218 family)
VAVLLAGLFHQPLLRGVGRAWVVDREAVAADAIVISVGTSPELLQQALAWWRAGKAPKLVLTRNLARPTDRAGITVPPAEQRRQELDAAGVPEAAREFIGGDSRLLREELAVVRAWAATNNVKRILVPAEPLAARRVGWLARRMLGSAGIEPVVVPVPVAGYSVPDWWRTKAGLMAMENEWALMAYYWWNY